MGTSIIGLSTTFSLYWIGDSNYFEAVCWASGCAAYTEASGPGFYFYCLAALSWALRVLLESSLCFKLSPILCRVSSSLFSLTSLSVSLSSLRRTSPFYSLSLSRRDFTWDSTSLLTTYPVLALSICSLFICATSALTLTISFSFSLRAFLAFYSSFCTSFYCPPIAASAPVWSYFLSADLSLPTPPCVYAETELLT